MTQAAATKLVAKLRAMGVAVRLDVSGAFQFKDCEKRMTPEQRAHVDRNRPALAEALRWEQLGGTETIAEHLPEELAEEYYARTSPAVGPACRTECRVFGAEMARKSLSAFCAQVAELKREGGPQAAAMCGRCAEMRADLWIEPVRRDREKQAERLARAAWREQKYGQLTPESESMEEA